MTCALELEEWGGLPAPYLGLDVLVRGRHQAGTAQPQHHHDGEEEAGSQDPARKARAPAAAQCPPPKREDKFTRVTRARAAQGPGGKHPVPGRPRGLLPPARTALPKPGGTYLDMQPRKSCSGCWGSVCWLLALPLASLTGGFSSFSRGSGGRHASPRDAVPSSLGTATPALRETRAPDKAEMLAWGRLKKPHPAAPHPVPIPQSSQASRAPSLLHLCGAAGCQGWQRARPSPSGPAWAPAPRAPGTQSQAGTEEPTRDREQKGRKSSSGPGPEISCGSTAHGTWALREGR